MQNQAFMFVQVPRLLRRFSLTYCRDDTCLEYFLLGQQTRDPVSQNLILSHDRPAKGIYVSKFYPQLFLEKRSKYLSAACFYLMIHHAVAVFGLADLCRIHLETDETVFRTFYARLPEFGFLVAHHRPCDRVCLEGCYHHLPIRTGQIRPSDAFSF